MGAVYDLWDLDSGNRLATYPTEAEALAAVRALLAEHRDEYAEALSLAVHVQSQGSRLIAQGQDLARLAEQSAGGALRVVADGAQRPGPRSTRSTGERGKKAPA